MLLALNPRSETIRADWQALKGFSDAYGGAATNIVNTLDQLSTTSVTITNNAKPLDALLLNVIGLSNSGIALLAPNQQNLIKAINVLEPTTNLLMKYNPEYTCMLVGAKWLLDNGAYDAQGGNGKSFIVDGGILAGDDQYRYPQNLPITGAKGGPGGKPGCGSLPIVDNNWPVRQLVTNTGWGTGVDIRPNPGIGFPGYGELPSGHPRCARSRPASATCSVGPRPARTPATRRRSSRRRATTRTVRRCTTPMAHRSGTTCRRHRRPAHRVTPAPPPVRSRSSCRSPVSSPHRCHPNRYPYRRRHRRDPERPSPDNRLRAPRGNPQ